MSYFPAPPKLHVMHVPGADSERDEVVSLLGREADVCVHEDAERDGVMPTWLAAIDCACETDTELSWSLIVQDDSEPFPGWQQHVERACTYSPRPILSLSHLAGSGLSAIEQGYPYVEGDFMLWGMAVAYHRSIRQGLAQWARSVYEKTGYPHDDATVMAYAYKIGQKTAITSRAIFDHRELKSMVRKGQHPYKHPKATIESQSGPPYGLKPSVAKDSRASMSQEVKELARL